MAPEPQPRGLLLDWGGVLTSDVFAGFQIFCEEEGLDPLRVRDLFAADPGGRQALVELETGVITEPEFEIRLAALLELPPERTPGLVDRVFGAIVAEEEIFEAIRIARASGIRTGLLSNSWGIERYPHDQLPELFDVVVISGQEGVRKPDEAIYEIAIERLALPAEEIVFVDDLPGNLKPARALGMITVHHTSAAQTLDELEQHFTMPLRAS
ncbi:MAG: HAD family phosphatase [Solirubrobacteraceae bacterium]|nr:HAD family phosphatase [Solirubrobacteraceae bacterium]